MNIFISYSNENCLHTNGENKFCAPQDIHLGRNVNIDDKAKQKKEMMDATK